MIEKQILETIEKRKLIVQNQHIVIGLSGGPDSVCLFHVLNKLSRKMNLTIHPVHINHKIRPGAAEADQSYVENLCKRNGLKCHSFVYDCNEIANREKITSEEAGRNARYESFASVSQSLREGGIPAENIVIAVAHNADDQAETILFRILRGTGTEGVSGMSYRRLDQYGNVIVRPLLDCFKSDILKYCEEENLKPCIDKTNEEALYTRNKIRLELIPSLERDFNSNVKDALIRLGKTASMDKEYISCQAEKLYAQALIEESETAIVLSGKLLREAHPAVRQRVVAKAFIKLGLGEDMSFAHFEGASGIIDSDKPSARIDFPKGFYLTKVYENIKAAKSGDSKMCRFTTREMSLEEFKELRTRRFTFGAFDKDELEAAFGKDFSERMLLRRREPGDFIALDEKASKKIQNYLVDKKVPKDLRDEAKLLTIGNEVLWILPGWDNGRYSGKYKLSETTKNVIYVELFS